MLILQKMLTLFLLMAVGFFLRKKNWLHDGNTGLLSKIVINVANPAMILVAGLDSATTLSNETLIQTFIAAVIFYALLTATAPLIVRIMRIPKDIRGTYQFMYIFGNIGFMGMPLITSIYGSEYALLVALFNFVFNVLIYTHGIGLYRKEARLASGETDAPEAGTGATLKNMVNAGTVGSILAMICFLTKLQAPDFLYSALDMCKSLACPLSMFVIGSTLATIEPKKLVSDMKLNAFILVRLVLIPILGISIVNLIAPGEILQRTFYVMISVPFASTCTMMASEYGGHTETASKGVALSTLVSVVTLPLVGALMGF